MAIEQDNITSKYFDFSNNIMSELFAMRAQIRGASSILQGVEGVDGSDQLLDVELILTEIEKKVGGLALKMDRSSFTFERKLVVEGVAHV